jgi:hypothetical protein
MKRALLAVCALLATAAAGAQERRNWFDDPFAQATHGLPRCPVPEPPLLSEAEMKLEAHGRAERGTTCWLQKKCATPNAYRDDRRINAAVVERLRAQPALASASLWVTTLRGFVFLKGCVRSEAQRRAALAAARAAPRVDRVFDELMLGTRGAPPYRVAGR